jgi:phage terminase small subunit
MVALYCDAYADWLKAMAAIKEYGAVIKTPNGYSCKRIIET